MYVRVYFDITNYLAFLKSAVDYDGRKTDTVVENYLKNIGEQVLAKTTARECLLSCSIITSLHAFQAVKIYCTPSTIPALKNTLLNGHC